MSPAPLPRGDFDLVIDFGTCHHIDGAELALKEIARVPSPGGVWKARRKVG